MRWSLLFVVGGCNQLLGLAPTTTDDARPPPMCPSIGSLPTLYGELHQLPLRRCDSYTPSRKSGTAIAMCDGTIVSGAIDQPMAPITLDPVPPRVERGPRLSAEGDRLLFPIYDADLSKYEIAEYEPAANGTWRSARPAVPYADVLTELSAPTLGPDRRLVFQTYDTTITSLVLVELSDKGGGWIENARYRIGELSLAAITANYPNLTQDGLRLVFVSDANVPGERYINQAVFYADRATLNDRFGTARVLDVAPHMIQTPYLTPDCGRLYFTALGTVFYME